MASRIYKTKGPPSIKKREVCLFFLVVLVKHGAHAVPAVQVRAVHVVELVAKAAGLVHGRVAHAQGVLGERETDAALDRVAQGVAVQVVQGLGGALHVLKLDKAHRSVRLCAEAEAAVANTAREQGAELILRSVHGQVAHIQRVARGVLVARVDGSAESRRGNTRGGQAGRSQSSGRSSVDGKTLETVIRQVIVAEQSIVEATLSVGRDRLGQVAHGRGRRLRVHAQEALVEALRASKANTVAERVGNRVGERSRDRASESTHIAEASHRQGVDSVVLKVATAQERRRELGLVQSAVVLRLVATSKGLGKGQIGVGGIDVSVKVVGAGVVVGGEQIRGQGRATGDRVEGVVGSSVGQAVAVLEQRMSRLVSRDVDWVNGG